MQDLHQTMQIFSQARHPTKTPEINGTETPHTVISTSGQNFWVKQSETTVPS
jgi:hypothetical protein